MAPLDGFDPDWITWTGRSSWSIASETIDLAAQQLVTGLERAQFRAAQTAADHRFAAAYRTEIEDLRREVESSLAEAACASLLAGDEPSRLDELFSASEHQAEFSVPTVGMSLPELPLPDVPAAPPVEVVVASTSSALVMEYAEAARERADGEVVDEELLIEGLQLVMGVSELTSLQDPDRVSEAYAVWKRSEHRRAKIHPWHWRQADTYVRNFFAFLNDRGRAAPLPAGLPQRSRSLFRRVSRRAASRGLALASLSLAAAAILALILGFAPAVSGGFSFDPILQLVDRLLTAGAFASGSALGPVLLGLMGGFWARLLLARQDNDQQGVGLQRGIGAVLLVVGSLVAVQPWSGGLGLPLVGALATAVILSFVGWLICNGVYRFEQMTGYRLLALLAAGFAVFSALPLLAGFGSPVPVLAVFVVSAAALFGTVPLRRARIPIVAFHIDDSKVMAEDSLQVFRPVAARLSVVPHAFALAFAWVASCAILDAGTGLRCLVAALVYLGVLVFWARLLTSLVTSQEGWEERMRLRKQTYDPVPGAPTLAFALGRARRRLLIGEIATVVPLIAVGTVVSAGAAPGLISQLPLGLATLCVAVIAVDLGSAFVRGLRSPLPGASEAPSDPLTYDSGGDAVKVRDLVGRYTRRLGGLLVALVAIRELLEIASLGEFVVHVYNWLTSLL